MVSAQGLAAAQSELVTGSAGRFLGTPDRLHGSRKSPDTVDEAIPVLQYELG